MRIYDYSDGQIKHLKLSPTMHTKLMQFVEEEREAKRRMKVKMWLK